jgi:hypothetical protein
MSEMLGGLMIGLFILVCSPILTGLFLWALAKLEESIKDESYL